MNENEPVVKEEGKMTEEDKMNENEPVVKEEDKMNENEPVKEEDKMTENEPVKEEDKMNENEPVVKEEDKMNENEPVVKEEDKMNENEPVVKEEDKMNENEPVVKEEDKMNENEPVVKEEDKMNENEPVVKEEDKMNENEPVVKEEDKMNENEPVVKEGEEKGLKVKLMEREKALERAMRLLENSQKYNEELRQQIEKLSSELHRYRSAAQNRVDAECQVDDKDIAEACGDKPFPDWGAPNDTAQASGAGESGISIADTLKAAAEEVVWEQAGYVYDSASGLYYDHNSGYYYDSTRGLYYDPSSTTYFYYDNEEQTYKFHSYATGYSGEQTSQTYEQGTSEASASQDIVSLQHTEKKGSTTREKSHKQKHEEKPKIKERPQVREECVDRLASDLQKLDIEKCRRNALEVSANYPPCIRIVVQTSDAVDVGTFFLVTYPGGTISRDSDARHAISLPDVNVSKVHAEIKYDDDNSCYTVQDCGSQNGTFVNDLRISESKEKSAAIPLAHGDMLRVAGTHMLLHIHPGTDTCDHCEPGQVLALLHAQQTVFNDHVVQTKKEKKEQARQELKKIKKKYGLGNCAYVDNVVAIQNPDYANKAELRRRYVGSDHPSHKQSHDVPASVHRPISSENKGHRMLAKMGWKEGSGLGKDNTGRAEPVMVELRANQNAGLGSTSAVGVSLDNVQSANRMRRLVQTQERYRRLDNPSSPSSSGGSVAEKNLGALGHSKGDRNRIPSRGLDGGVSPAGRTTDAQSGRGSKKKIEIKWIQGQTQNGT